MDYVISVLFLLSFRARMFDCALRSPAVCVWGGGGGGGAGILALVCGV